MAVGASRTAGRSGTRASRSSLRGIRLGEDGAGPSRRRSPRRARGGPPRTPGCGRRPPPSCRGSLRSQAELDAARDEMDVGILEGRQDHPAAEVDDARRAAPKPRGRLAVADEEDPSLRRRPRPRPGAGPRSIVTTAAFVRMRSARPAGPASAARRDDGDRGEEGQDGGPELRHRPRMISHRKARRKARRSVRGPGDSGGSRSR